MATLKQIEANRLNALKSTGPKTPQGKAAVRLNSLQHGLRAAVVVLPGEKQEEFDQLCAALEAEWQPQSPTASFYLEQMAIAQWKLRRIELAEASLLAQSLPAAVQIPLLDRLWQSQARLERSFARAHKDLERIERIQPEPGPAARQPVSSPDDPVRDAPPATKWVCSSDLRQPFQAAPAFPAGLPLENSKLQLVTNVRKR
ncbi:MAG TPA: hypothetical protein VL285_10770 [Bryobacteraceae bacterium]|nr:hypothetical protein [Bryobacteraceae bacterium]